MSIWALFIVDSGLHYSVSGYTQLLVPAKKIVLKCLDITYQLPLLVVVRALFPPLLVVCALFPPLLVVVRALFPPLLVVGAFPLDVLKILKNTDKGTLHSEIDITHDPHRLITLEDILTTRQKYTPPHDTVQQNIHRRSHSLPGDGLHVSYYHQSRRPMILLKKMGDAHITYSSFTISLYSEYDIRPRTLLHISNASGHYYTYHTTSITLTSSDPRSKMHV